LHSSISYLTIQTIQWAKSRIKRGEEGVGEDQGQDSPPVPAWRRIIAQGSITKPERKKP